MSTLVAERIAPPAPASRQWLGNGEHLLLVVALAAMMILPVAEIFLRSIFKTGISGSSAIVQHLTLIVGMLGGAIAAREGRLLALSLPKHFSKAGPRRQPKFSAARSQRPSAFSSAWRAHNMFMQSSRSEKSWFMEFQPGPFNSFSPSALV